jgi:hypothetical protein
MEATASAIDPSGSATSSSIERRDAATELIRYSDPNISEGTIVRANA